MMLLPPIETFVPEDYPLRKLHRILDLSFVHDAVRDRYCPDNGRPSVDPEVVLRLFILQALEGIRSVRELMREVQVNLAYRWFIGYRLDEALPDHSTLSRALDRFGDEVFNQLFVRSIALCKASGLIDGRVLHLDATLIRADLEWNQVGQPDSSDPDARYGKFPQGHIAPGYKQQTVADGKARVVVALAVTPADESEHNGAVEVVDAAIAQAGVVPEAVCADTAYGSGEHKAAMEERGIRFVSPPKPVTNAKRGYFTVEDFRYDEKEDVFTCPAGATLRYVGRVRSRPKQRRYAAPRAVCGACALKGRCTQASRREVKVSAHHAALLRLRAESRTEDFQQLYRTRAPVIEGVFAEAKQWHGLRRAWRRGLSNMRVQCLLIAAVINLKRLVAYSGLSHVLLGVLLNVWARLRDRIRAYPTVSRSTTGPLTNALI